MVRGGRVRAAGPGAPPPAAAPTELEARLLASACRQAARRALAVHYMAACPPADEPPPSLAPEVPRVRLLSARAAAAGFAPSGSSSVTPQSTPRDSQSSFSQSQSAFSQRSTPASSPRWPRPHEVLAGSRPSRGLEASGDARQRSSPRGAGPEFVAGKIPSLRHVEEEKLPDPEQRVKLMKQQSVNFSAVVFSKRASRLSLSELETGSSRQSSGSPLPEEASATPCVRRGKRTLTEERKFRAKGRMSEEEQNVATWVHAATGHDDLLEVSAGRMELQEALRSGEALCDLVEHMWPGQVQGVVHRGSTKLFRWVENVTKFLKVCGDSGLPPRDRFEPIHLTEGKDMRKVVRCLCALGALAAAHGIPGPHLELAMSPPPPLTEKFGSSRRNHLRSSLTSAPSSTCW